METPLLEEIKNETLSDLEIKQEEINFELIIKEERFEIDEQVDNVSNNDTECNVELSKEKTEESDSIEFLQVKDEVVDSEWTEYDEQESDPLALAEFDSENKSDSMKDESSNEPNTSQDTFTPATLEVHLVHDNTNDSLETASSVIKVVNYSYQNNKTSTNGANLPYIGIWPHVCLECDTSFSEAKYLERHKLKKHSGETPYKCEECSFACDAPYKLLVHRRKHLQDKPFKCEQCSYSTITSYNLKVHIARHPHNGTFKCSDCDFVSISYNGLQTHTRYKHTKDGQFKCSECDYSTLYSRCLKMHFISKHTSIKPYKCSKCNFSTSRSNHLKSHIASIHKKEKPYKCTLCSFCSSFSNNVKCHMMSKHSTEKPFKCTECDYCSSRMNSLKRHTMSKHSVEKPHKCPQCDYRSVQRKYLLKHMNKHHKE